MLPCLLDWLYWTTSPFIHHTSLLLLWEIVCESVQYLYVIVPAYLWVFSCTKAHIAIYTCVWCWVDECVHVHVRRGVVRQLTSCANDHLTAVSHNVLQHHTVLYCLCCHGDVVFSTIKCWYWLIVLASSGLCFYVHTHTCRHTQTNTQIYSLCLLHTHTHTYMQTHCFMAYVFFMSSVYLSALGPISSCRSPLS